MCGKPPFGGAAEATQLLLGHHLERVAKANAALRLHLAEHERATAAGDDVELVATDPDVRAEDAVAAHSIPPRCAALRSVPRLRGARRRGNPRSSVRSTTAGGFPTGRRGGRRRCGRA